MKKRKIRKGIFVGFICVFFGFLFLGFFHFCCKPKLVLIGKDTVFLEVGRPYHEPGVRVRFLDQDVNPLVLITNLVDKDTLGSYDVVYQYENQIVKRKVVVVDRTAPVITLNGKETEYVCKGKMYQEAGYKATDNYDRNLTKKVVRKEVADGIFYEVKDSSNNFAVVKRKIVIGDFTAPELMIDTPLVVYVNDSFHDLVQAQDYCDGDLTSKIRMSGVVDTSKVGTYQRTYEVEDAAFHKTKKTITITVKEKPKKEHKKIYLTFDDGPSLDATPIVLNTLQKYQVKATFFVLNHGNKLDFLLKREQEDGHTIGYHGNSHVYSKIYRNDEAFLENIRLIEDKVYRVTNSRSKILRFPGGSSNTISRDYNKKIMMRLTKKVENLGYIYQDWNVDSKDTETQNSKTICRNVTDGLQNGTNIVLLHDATSKTGSAQAVECIIKYGLSHGYTFDRITSKTPFIHHSVNN